jgi:RNA polymerase sigma factor (TIGR02999 family)
MIPSDRNGELLPDVYAQLRAMAQDRLRHERAGHTLQATALVHEVYLRLRNAKDVDPASTRQFFFAAAEAMRRILIEHARKRGRLKRGGTRGTYGGARERIPLECLDLAQDLESDQILAVDEAIRRLQEQDKRLGQIVRLRFFAGLTVEQTAAALDVSDRTVRRDWRLARAWLRRELGQDEG